VYDDCSVSMVLHKAAIRRWILAIYSGLVLQLWQNDQVVFILSFTFHTMSAKILHCVSKNVTNHE